jgi:hypothetical protein
MVPNSDLRTVLKLTSSLWFVGLAVVAGCNRSPYPVAPVQGTVTIDGQPMTGGRVMFAPVAKDGLNSGRPAFGEIQQDGSFTLSTYRGGDGAVVGEHWVSIVNDQSAIGNSAPQSAGRAALTRNAPATKETFYRIVFPRKVVTVNANQENQINIAMTSQDIANFAKVADADN